MRRKNVLEQPDKSGLILTDCSVDISIYAALLSKQLSR